MSGIMKIAILGAGNIGTLIGAKLAKLDSTDIFIHARGDHAASLAVNGISVEGIENFSLKPNQYHLSISDVGINSTFDGLADVVFICSKAVDVGDFYFSLFTSHDFFCNSCYLLCKACSLLLLLF